MACGGAGGGCALRHNRPAGASLLLAACSLRPAGDVKATNCRCAASPTRRPAHLKQVAVQASPVQVVGQCVQVVGAAAERACTGGSGMVSGTARARTQPPAPNHLLARYCLEAQADSRAAVVTNFSTATPPAAPALFKASKCPHPPPHPPRHPPHLTPTKPRMREGSQTGDAPSCGCRVSSCCICSMSARAPSCPPACMECKPTKGRQLGTQQHVKRGHRCPHSSPHNCMLLKCRQGIRVISHRLPHKMEALAVAAEGGRVAQHPGDAGVHVLQHV